MLVRGLVRNVAVTVWLVWGWSILSDAAVLVASGKASRESASVLDLIFLNESRSHR
jgi:hypothetical protein